MPMIFERGYMRHQPLVLHTSDPRNFRVTFKILNDGIGNDEWNCILCGIIPKSCRRHTFAIVEGRPTFGYFMTDFGFMWGQDGTYRYIFTNCMEEDEMFLHFRGDPVPQLFACRNEGSVVDLNFNSPMPVCDYMPCVILLVEGAAVEVTVHEGLAPQEGLQPSVLARMWADRRFTDAEVVCEERRFTDAEVVCEEKVFPVHREVLSIVSPVFRMAFSQENMKEGQSRRIEINTATATTVEALLRFMYGDMHEADMEEVNVIELLHLAHVYDIQTLVCACGQALMGKFASDNAVATVRALRTYREDPDIAPVWNYLLYRLQHDGALLEELLLS